MSQQIQAPTHTFQYRNFRINKTQCLGHGAYGAVYKASCDQLTCAAKVLHPTIVDPYDPGAGKILQRFDQECGVMSGIRHPHIVQYLGLTRDPETRLPVLLMELLDESLTRMLERSKDPLPYSVQVDLCHDITLAVSYLHSNSIIHRDLSSNNVLIMAGRRAKVTDFGMLKIADSAPRMTPLTMCPGTLAYMSPEALKDLPVYNEKMDNFSLGVLYIQICTRLWPEPGQRTRQVPFAGSPTGTIEMPVIETERRKTHIDLIDPTHPLLAIAIPCLNYNEGERPPAQELCQRLSVLKEAPEYTESVQPTSRLSYSDPAEINQLQRDEANLQNQLLREDIQHKETTIAELTQENQQLQRERDQISGDLNRQIQNKDQQIREKDQQVREKDQQVREKDRQVRVKDEQVRDKDQQLRVKDQQVREKDEIIISIQRQLQESEENTAEFQRANHKLQKQIEGLQLQPSKQVILSPRSSEVVKRKEGIKLTWKDGGKAPMMMDRGASVVDGGKVYFRRGGRMISYNSATQSWDTLPKCSITCGSLAMVRGFLTMIGGMQASGGQVTNKLVSLVRGVGGERKWVERFPSMPTKCSYSAAVSSGKHLIVAGGSKTVQSRDNHSTVQVMDTDSLIWSTAASLPHPLAYASAVICDNCIYMLGGDDQNGRKSKSVFVCSLTELLQVNVHVRVWHRIADLPVWYSTSTTVYGQLLAVGGRDGDNTPTTAVHMYNMTTNSWEVISHMAIARWRNFVAVLPSSKLMVVGGNVNVLGTSTDSTEIAEIEC